MFALMTIWFGRLAGLPQNGGYFYLCPSCYAVCITPTEDRILEILAAEHPYSASRRHRDSG